jgi:hypothetical protein
VVAVSLASLVLVVLAVRRQRASRVRPQAASTDS